MPSIQVGGMSCQHCVQSVTRALSAVPGITEVAVSLEHGKATFQAPAALDWDAVRAAIAKAGFEPGKEES